MNDDEIPARADLFIDGAFTEARDGRRFAVHAPADGSEIAACSAGGAADIDRAVAAARRAFEEWREEAPSERADRLRALADALEANAENLARLVSREMGKPIRESTAVEIPHAAAVVRYYAEWCDKVYGETCPVAPGFLNYTLREPLGVVGAITAWNFPLILAVWKAAPALAMGNTVVLKPAEQAPLTVLRLAELAAEAGFPGGVLNVVPGLGPEAGAALAAHPGVDKIAFTGEHTTAQEVIRAAAPTLKKVSYECGGKSPHVVFPDADPKGAAKSVFTGIFSNQGQVCNAGSRLFVQRGFGEEIVERIVERARGLRLGDPLDETTEIGPLVSAEQLERVTGLVEASRDAVDVRCGGGPAEELNRGGGWYMEPTVLAHVHPGTPVADREIFGPVLSVLEFDDEDDLVRMANDTVYGLAAGVWTKDVSRAHRLARRLQAGVVWVNCYGLFDVSSPFGGYKASGVGKELGKHALDLYTQTKSVWVRT